MTNGNGVNLRSIDGLIKLMHIETGEPEDKLREKINIYILEHKKIHYGREDVNIGRQYVCEYLQKLNQHKQYKEIK